MAIYFYKDEKSFTDTEKKDDKGRTIPANIVFPNLDAGDQEKLKCLKCLLLDHGVEKDKIITYFSRTNFSPTEEFDVTLNFQIMTRRAANKDKDTYEWATQSFKMTPFLLCAVTNNQNSADAILIFASRRKNWPQDIYRYRDGYNGMTALHICSIYGHETFAKWLLEKEDNFIIETQGRIYKTIENLKRSDFSDCEYEAQDFYPEGGSLAEETGYTPVELGMLCGKLSYVETLLGLSCATTYIEQVKQRIEDKSLLINPLALAIVLKKERIVERLIELGLTSCEYRYASELPIKSVMSSAHYGSCKDMIYFAIASKNLYILKLCIKAFYKSCNESIKGIIQKCRNKEIDINGLSLAEILISNIRFLPNGGSLEHDGEIIDSYLLAALKTGDYDIVSYILSQNVDVNEGKCIGKLLRRIEKTMPKEDEPPSCPILYSIYAIKLELAMLLLKYRANITVIDEYSGNNILHYLIECRSKIAQKDKSKNTTYIDSIYNALSKDLEYLSTHTNKEGETPLIYGCRLLSGLTNENSNFKHLKKLLLKLRQDMKPSVLKVVDKHEKNANDYFNLS